MTKLSMKIVRLLETRLFKVKDIAKMLGCTLGTVYHHANDYWAVEPEVNELIKGAFKKNEKSKP